MGQIRAPKTRRDGWTAERQLRFLDVLARTRSITRAARAVGIKFARAPIACALAAKARFSPSPGTARCKGLP